MKGMARNARKRILSPDVIILQQLAKVELSLNTQKSNNDALAPKKARMTTAPQRRGNN